MTRLAGFPSGLLSLVGSANFGDAPNQMGDVIAPCIELQDLYLLTAQEPEILIVAAPANGINAGIRVPAGEVWKVVQGGVFVDTGAGVSLTSWTPVVEASGGVIPIADSVLAHPASQTILKAIHTPFWVKAGDQVSVYIRGLAGVPTISIALLISRLRA